MKKYALVTGGSRGIGKACCMRLAKMGYSILINYVSNEAAATETLNAVKALGVDAELLKFNVAKKEEVESAINQWQEKNPEEFIQVLVNNAGIRKDNLMFWMSDDEWHQVTETNLNGTFYTTRAVLKYMLNKKNGRIINIVSLSGIKGMPGQANYSAAKAGVIGMTKALAQEAAKKRVTVNAIAPGFIETDMTSSLPVEDLKKLVPLNRFGTAEEVAALVGFLASDESAYSTGEVISINGGLHT